MGQLGCITWRQIEPRVYRFRDALDFQCHLVVGERRALLIDAMGGHGDLRAAVAQVTDLPVTVVATHSHYDHVAGSGFFDEASKSSIKILEREKDLRNGKNV